MLRRMGSAAMTEEPDRGWVGVAFEGLDGGGAARAAGRELAHAFLDLAAALAVAAGETLTFTEPRWSGPPRAAPATSARPGDAQPDEPEPRVESMVRAGEPGGVRRALERACRCVPDPAPSLDVPLADIRRGVRRGLARLSPDRSGRIAMRVGAGDEGDAHVLALDLRRGPWARAATHAAMLARAVLRCWPAWATAAALLLVLMRVPQGVELLPQRDWDAIVLGYAALTLWLVCVWRMSGWNAADRSAPARYARFSAPLVVFFVVVILLPVVAGSAAKMSLSPVEAGDLNGLMLWIGIVGITAIGGRAYFLYASLRTRHKEGHAVPVVLGAVAEAAVALTCWWQQGRFDRAGACVTLGAIVVVDAVTVAKSDAATFDAGALRGLEVIAVGWCSLVFIVALTLIPLGSLARVPGAFTCLLGAWAFWMVFWALFGAVASLRCWRWLAFALVGWLGVCVLFGPFNQTRVRALQTRVRALQTPSASAPSLTAQVSAWLDARVRQGAIGDETGPYPVVIAAAEGGGIRAAYFAAGVLAAMSDREPALPDHILAMSGVSGGSVGVGVFAAVLSARGRAMADGGHLPCSAEDRVFPCVAQVLGRDLLAAPLVGLLLDDVWRVGLLDHLIPDRTALLEMSLERALGEATGDSFGDRPWQDLWRGPGGLHVPLAVSNTTRIADGRRAVWAPFPAPGRWQDAADLGGDPALGGIRLSTAIFASARFPVISTTALVGAPHHERQFVDGGYADNSGVATALDLVEVLARAVETRNLEGRVVPVVMVISNSEPRTGPEHQDDGGPGLLARGLLGGFADPIATLAAVSSATSGSAMARLRARVAELGGRVVDDLRLDHVGARYPLGWTLSSETRRFLDDRVAGVAFGRALAAPPPPECLLARAHD